jgi:hypothetical protein
MRYKVFSFCCVLCGCSLEHKWKSDSPGKQHPVQNYDSPAKQHPVPNDDNPAITTSSFLQILHIPMIETSFWHQAFDTSLSHRLIMNVTDTTSVHALNALLTSSYLHPAAGMTAHTDATPTTS